MVKKSFRVTIYFDMHQVSSPGVWLCPKGCVFLTVSLFRCIESTKQVKPAFPMKIHERFVFDKIFDNVSSLADLQERLSKKDVKLEIVQIFRNRQKIVTLGVFQAPLTSILYPYLSDKSDCGSAEVDLLFECCKPYPGIIAPKAEVSTRAVIEELRLCPKFTEGPVNPTLVSSTKKNEVKRRTKPVCHTKPVRPVVCNCCVDYGLTPPGSSDNILQLDRASDGESSCSSSSSSSLERCLSDEGTSKTEELVNWGDSAPHDSRQNVIFQRSHKKFQKASSNEKRVTYENDNCHCFNCMPKANVVESVEVPWKVYRCGKGTPRRRKNGEKEVILENYGERKNMSDEQAKGLNKSTVQTQTSAICRCNDELNTQKEGRCFRQRQMENKRLEPMPDPRTGAERINKENDSNEMKLCECCYKQRCKGKLGGQGPKESYITERKSVLTKEKISKTSRKKVDPRTCEEVVPNYSYEGDVICTGDEDTIEESQGKRGHTTSREGNDNRNRPGEGRSPSHRPRDREQKSQGIS